VEDRPAAAVEEPGRAEAEPVLRAEASRDLRDAVEQHAGSLARVDRDGSPVQDRSVLRDRAGFDRGSAEIDPDRPAGEVDPDGPGGHSSTETDFTRRVTRRYAFR